MFDRSRSSWRGLGALKAQEKEIAEKMLLSQVLAAAKSKELTNELFASFGRELGENPPDHKTKKILKESKILFNESWKLYDLIQRCSLILEDQTSSEDNSVRAAVFLLSVLPARKEIIQDVTRALCLETKENKDISRLYNDKNLDAILHPGIRKTLSDVETKLKSNMLVEHLITESVKTLVTQILEDTKNIFSSFSEEDFDSLFSHHTDGKLLPNKKIQLASAFLQLCLKKNHSAERGALETIIALITAKAGIYFGRLAVDMEKIEDSSTTYTAAIQQIKSDFNGTDTINKITDSRTFSGERPLEMEVLTDLSSRLSPLNFCKEFSTYNFSDASLTSMMTQNAVSSLGLDGFSSPIRERIQEILNYIKEAISLYAGRNGRNDLINYIDENINENVFSILGNIGRYAVEKISDKNPPKYRAEITSNFYKTLSVFQDIQAGNFLEKLLSFVKTVESPTFTATRSSSPISIAGIFGRRSPSPDSPSPSPTPSSEG